MVSIGDLPTHPFYNAGESEYGYYGSLLTPRNYLSVTAAAAMVRKDVFEEVSGFDEEFAHDFNDVDFCYRIHQAGYRNVWTPFAHFEHVEGASIVRTQANPLESELFLTRYQGKFDPDPYYSPRLKQDIRRLYEFQ
jgi:GT2 family glycosyltransferase